MIIFNLILFSENIRQGEIYASAGRAGYVLVVVCM